jgi:hypothetical protein
MPKLLTCKCGSLDLAAAAKAVSNVWHQAAAMLRTLIGRVTWPTTQHMTGFLNRLDLRYTFPRIH